LAIVRSTPVSRSVDVRRSVVKIIAKSLSQHAEHIVPLGGIREEEDWAKRVKKGLTLVIYMFHIMLLKCRSYRT
jgi:hypothetical protein